MKEQKYTHVKHEFAPIYDERSTILILGTLPSVMSREQQFYYGHPRNRFWKLLSHLFGEQNTPQTIEEKKSFLLQHHVALWDVIDECDIIGSSDNSIKNVKPTDVSLILNHSPIRRVYANGNKAYELYMKYSYDLTGTDITKMPSTSPANAAFQMDRLAEAWKVIVD